MKAIVSNRPDDRDGAITLYPETVEEAAQIEAFLLDGFGVNLKLERFISANKRAIYFELYYDRGQERKIKGT